MLFHIRYVMLLLTVAKNIKLFLFISVSYHTIISGTKLLEMDNIATENATKHAVAIALKNTAKGQLNYDTSWSCSFDSLQVCIVYVLSYRVCPCQM